MYIMCRGKIVWRFLFIFGCVLVSGGGGERKKKDFAGCRAMRRFIWAVESGLVAVGRR